LLRDGFGRDMSLDMHLHSHLPALLDMIRDRCIAQYFRPYSSVSLGRMGRVFGCTALEMEGVVAKLLSAVDGGGDGDGMVPGERRARINAHDGTLCVEGPGSAERRARRRARVMAARMGRQFAREMEGVILREFALTRVPLRLLCHEGREEVPVKCIVILKACVHVITMRIRLVLHRKWDYHSIRKTIRMEEPR
jgi:hypothetical protein